MFTREEIGQKLQRLRLEKFGDNIREFERQSGVSRGSIPKAESGDGFPMLDTLAKWLQACQISFAHFFEEFEPFKEAPVQPGGYKRQHKRYHEELEFVLVRIGVSESVTAKTLKLEYEKARGTMGPTPPGQPDTPNGALSPSHRKITLRDDPDEVPVAEWAKNRADDKTDSEDHAHKRSKPGRLPADHR